MFRHLLIPLDGSSLAEAVVPAVSFLAGKCGSRVTLLHVIESDTPGTVHGERHLRSFAEAEAYLKDLAGRGLLQGVKVDWHVHEQVTANVAQSLAAHTEEFEPDLVVMCAHGQDRLRNMLFGNIAQQTFKTSRIPILMLEPCPGTGCLPFRQLLLPLDGLKEHEQGLPLAAFLAGTCSASLQLLMVIPTPGSLSGEKLAVGSLLPGTTRAILDLEEERAVGYLQGHAQRLEQQGLTVRAKVTRGDPVEQIAETVAAISADLVVLGTHGKSGTQAFWSASVASKLISRINVSFLLVPASPLS
jgi:nucleotide-binding universal stress UspA family protein